MPAVQRRAFPLAGLMCTLRGIAHTHEGKAGITVPANASSSFSRRGDEESFETSTRTKIYWGSLREEDFSIITTRGGKIFLTSPRDAGNLCTSTRKREGEFLESIKKGLPTIANPVYGYSAPEKSGVGIGVPVIIRAHNTRHACFFVPRSYTCSMVDCMGAEQSAPVSLIPGYANPVQFTTSEIGVSGGGSISPIKEAAIMATVPALTRLNDEDLHKLSYVTTALRALRKVTLSDPQAHQVLVETLLNLQAERIRLADKANFHIHRLLNISGGHRHA